MEETWRNMKNHVILTMTSQETMSTSPLNSYQVAFLDPRSDAIWPSHCVDGTWWNSDFQLFWWGSVRTLGFLQGEYLSLACPQSFSKDLVARCCKVEKGWLSCGHWSSWTNLRSICILYTVYWCIIIIIYDISLLVAQDLLKTHYTDVIHSCPSKILVMSTTWWSYYYTARSCR